jgi:hypothetical protein
MFGGVDRAIAIDDLLRTWNAQVVRHLKAKVSETGSNGRAGRDGQLRAASSAVEVQREIGTPAQELRGAGRQDSIDVAVTREYWSESVFDNDGELEIGTSLFKEGKSGGCEHAIAQRAQPNDSHPGAIGQLLQWVVHESTRELRLDLGLVDEHHRNVIAYGIDPLALNAFQAAAVGLQFDGGFAQGTNENLQQILTDSHGFDSV